MPVLFIAQGIPLCSGAVIGAWVTWGLFVIIYILILYYTMNICGNCDVNRAV